LGLGSVKLATLYYIHDPMCSWCWAFRPVWTAMQKALPETLVVKYLLGGLAPDSASPMPAATQAMIRRHWHTIQKRVPGTEFNFGFWTECTPRRSTYPACRAVIAARQQNPELEDAMIQAIQQAYYLQARNPSDDDVLIDLASGLSLDTDTFQRDLNATETHRRFMDEMQQAQRIGLGGFPSLMLETDEANHPIHIDYNHADVMINELAKIIAL